MDFIMHNRVYCIYNPVNSVSWITSEQIKSTDSTWRSNVYTKESSANKKLHRKTTYRRHREKSTVLWEKYTEVTAFLTYWLKTRNRKIMLVDRNITRFEKKITQSWFELFTKIENLKMKSLPHTPLQQWDQK